MFWWNDVLLLGQTTDCAKRGNIWQIQDFFFLFRNTFKQAVTHTVTQPSWACQVKSAFCEPLVRVTVKRFHNTRTMTESSTRCHYVITVISWGVLTKADTEGLLWNHFTKRAKLFKFFRHSNLMINSNITIQEICKCYVVHHIAFTFYFVYCILYQPLDIVIFWNCIFRIFSWYQRLNYSKVMQLEFIWAYQTLHSFW